MTSSLDGDLLPRRTSVVMTTYNGERFLTEQLLSLAQQSSPPLELVVGDDGSNDCTLEILAKFARWAPFPVRVHVNKTRLGFAANFLFTARQAAGELISFCDQDDVWHADKLMRVEAAISEEDILLCGHTAWLIDETGREIGTFPNGIQHSQVIQPFGKRYWPRYYGFTVTARKSVVQSLVKYMERPDGTWRTSVYAHDGWITFVAAITGRIRELEDALVGYRQHGSNVVGARPEWERFSTSTELDNNVRYLAITDELIDYLHFRTNSHDEPARQQIDRALQIYSAIRKHIETKNDSQAAATIFQSFRRLLLHATRGDYRDPYDSKFRFRSFAHDLLFIPRRFVIEPLYKDRSSPV